MRIISGTAKGRTLKAPTWDGLRPTSDRLRETLFNILASRIDDARVLDLFAGTGAIGLEALSRGAAHAVFVDADRRAVALIAENARRAKLADRCVIIREAVERALSPGARTEGVGGPFDIVVLDPPYALPDVAPALTLALRTLAPGGLGVLEHAWRRRPPGVPGGGPTRTVRAGDSALSFYGRVEGDRER